MMRERWTGKWRSIAVLLSCIAAWQVPVPVEAGPRPFDFGERVLETVGAEDDIPNGVITALAQGADGYLWIGTQKGLLRFDGYRFRRFEHRVDDPASLGGDFIFSMAVDHEGRVWAWP
jgi:hypothetical protein